MTPSPVRSGPSSSTATSPRQNETSRGGVPFGYPYLLVRRAPQGLLRPQQCVPEPEPADHSRGPHIHHASCRHKPGSQAGPVPTAPRHPPANQNERFAPTLTLAWRDGLSRFRTCLRAPVSSTSHRPKGASQSVQVAAVRHTNGTSLTVYRCV